MCCAYETNRTFMNRQWELSLSSNNHNCAPMVSLVLTKLVDLARLWSNSAMETHLIRRFLSRSLRDLSCSTVSHRCVTPGLIIGNEMFPRVHCGVNFICEMLLTTRSSNSMMKARLQTLVNSDRPPVIQILLKIKTGSLWFVYLKLHIQYVE